MTNYLGMAGKILLLPLRSVTFSDAFAGSDRANDFALFELESESSYSLMPILRSDDRGGQRTLGYRVDATIFSPHNKLSDNGILDKLEYFSKKRRVQGASASDHYHATLTLGINDTTSELKGGSTNSTGKQSITLCNLNGNVGLSWSVESLEFRQRLKISITSNFKPVKGGFNQYSAIFGE